MRPSAADWPITVLLVDDQPMVADVLRGMLAGESDIQLHYCENSVDAIRQANALSPTVILQDLVMPEIDGLTLVRFYRANPATRDTPLIVLSSTEDAKVKAEAFLYGASDYLVKLPDRLEMLARIRYHAKGFIAQMERNAAYCRLAESQQRLAEEIAEAAKYVRSMLPAPLHDGPIRVDWRFIPSTDLGGDSFGYHWLDEHHFAVYLLDVCGHGVGSSLMSVSALDMLRFRTLPDTDFRDPGQVLQGLNRTFDIDLHDGKFFTIWYGVFNTAKKELKYAGAGHPPGLLFDPTVHQHETSRLESKGSLIGITPDLPFTSDTVQLGPAAKLLLYSDGAYEVQMRGGEMWKFEDFVEFITRAPADQPVLDTLLSHLYAMKGEASLSDDFSMMEIEWLGRRTADTY